MKKMNLTEFRQLGLLQEINRILLHPMGLALVVRCADDGKETIDYLIDSRDDPEGMCFEDNELSEEYFNNCRKMFNEKRINRFIAVGYHVQQIKKK